MIEKPILFSGPMVRAILAGRKTQTRRVARVPVPGTKGEHCWPIPKAAQLLRDGTLEFSFDGGFDKDVRSTRSPYGIEGDRLWVRETFAFLDEGDGKKGGPYYRAEPFHAAAIDREAGERWTPAIHMPRRLCRLVLEVTKLRVERLQDITSDDAIAEGIEPSDVGDAREESAFNVAAYAELWDSLNKSRGYGWDVNPWVWVIEFRRADSLRRAA